MRRLLHSALVLVPALILAGAFLQLASAQTPAPPVAGPGCQIGLSKIAEPSTIGLGETVKVTMVVTSSCPSVAPPMDLMFLVDISNSMTKGEESRITDPCGPDPGVDPLPTKPDPNATPGDQTKEPPEPTQPGASEPTVCPTRPGVLPIIDPTRPPISQPTTVPTKTTPGTPGTPGTDPTSHVPTPGSVIGGPTRSAVIDPRPIEDPGTEDLIREMQKFIRDFTTEPTVQQAAAEGRLRVALVAFESRPHTIAGLTAKLTRITSGVSRLDSLPHGTTNVAMGFYRANQLMDRGLDATRGANRVIVVLSDGKFDARTVRGLRTRQGIIHLAVAMGKSPDLRLLNDIVTERHYLLGQRDYPAFFDLYTNELQKPRVVTLARALVHDELQSNMRYVTGSAWPTATVTGQVIEWLFEPVTTPVTVTYEVEPLEGGVLPISVAAHTDWLDTIGRSGSLPFPDVEVVVIPPSVTPTSTPTSTPSPTITPTLEPGITPSATRKPPQDLYLPVALRQPRPKACVPSEQTVDVAIVIDTSDSMLQTTSTGRSKMEAAVQAGRLLADLLKLDAGGDQVAVIGFNSEAFVLSGLTGSSSAVLAALDQLPDTQARGTKIDTAVLAALEIMTGPGRRAGNSAAMVLLTDGRHEGEASAVSDAADRLKAAGVNVHTVGLGEDVDSDLLSSVATEAAYYHYAPDAEGLEDIYRRIAAVVACP